MDNFNLVACLGAFSVSFPKSVAFPAADRAGSISRIESASGLLSGNGDLSHFLYSRYYDVPGLVAFAYPDPSAFITGIKNEYFPEIQSFIAAAIAISLIALLLKGLIS